MKPIMKTIASTMLGCFTILLFATAHLFAHTTNEQSYFPDIGSSKSRFDILALAAVGIIPPAALFEPDLPMTQRHLATWLAYFNNIGPGGESPDIDVLARAALDHGLMKSIEGATTYASINDLMFAGQLTVESPESTPTKGEAASYIASKLSLAAGESLLSRRGLQSGPVGEVVSVESRVNADGGSSFYITVGEMTLPMYVHGRVANGPTDLLLWKGRILRRSFIRKQGDFRLWVYLEASDLTSAGPDKSDHNHTQHSH